MSKRRTPAPAPVPGRGRELSELRRRSRRWGTRRPGRGNEKRRAIAREDPR